MNSKIIITGHHIDLSDSTREWISTLVGKLLSHHNQIIRVRVEIDATAARTGERDYHVRGLIELRGADLVASDHTTNLSASLHLVLDKLTRMLSDRTHRREDARRHPHPVELGAALPKV